MENWNTYINTSVKTKLNNVKDRDLRFFRIDEFLRNIERTDNFSESCAECNNHKTDISNITEKIDEAINVPGKTRREFDRIIGRLSKHMKKSHGFYPPYHYSYIYSFLGIISGLTVGYLGSLIYPSDDWIALVIGFVIFLFTGHFIGSKKDKQIRKNNKLM